MPQINERPVIGPDEAATQRSDVMLENLGFPQPKRGSKLSIPTKVLPLDDKDLKPGQPVTITISGRVLKVGTNALELEVDSAEMDASAPEVPEGGAPMGMGEGMMPQQGGM